MPLALAALNACAYLFSVGVGAAAGVATGGGAVVAGDVGATGGVAWVSEGATGCCVCWVCCCGVPAGVGCMPGAFASLSSCCVGVPYLSVNLVSPGARIGSIHPACPREGGELFVDTVFEEDELLFFAINALAFSAVDAVYGTPLESVTVTFVAILSCYNTTNTIHPSARGAP